MNYPKLNTKLITTLGSIIFMPSRDIIAATDIATSTWYTLMQLPTAYTFPFDVCFLLATLISADGEMTISQTLTYPVAMMPAPYKTSSAHALTPHGNWLPKKLV